MPRRVAAILVTLFVLSLVPFACIFRARATLSPRPRIHLIQGMDNQPRYKQQMVNPAFADTRADRPWPVGTIPRGKLDDDPARLTGHVGEKWVDTFPVPVSAALLARGRERFGIYCAPCHGLNGEGLIGPTLQGNSTLADRARLKLLLENGKGQMPPVGKDWTPHELAELTAYLKEKFAGGG